MGVILGSHVKKEKCHYCLKDAEFLCDWPFSRHPKYMDSIADYETCDRPLCKDHTRQQAERIFMCGRGKKLRLESWDWCPQHDTKYKLTGRYFDYRPKPTPGL